MNDQRNLILAVVLSAIVLFGWSFLSERFFPTAAPQTQVVKQGETKALPQPAADPAADAPAAIRTRAAVLAETPRLAIETPSLRGSVNLRGLRIDDLVLIRHREALAASSPPIRLFSPSGAPDAYFASFGWAGTGLILPGADAQWTASAPRLVPGQPVTLGWSNGQGQRFEVVLAVDSGYLFTTTQRVVNEGTGAVVVRPFGLVSRTGTGSEKDTFTIHIGPIGVIDGQLKEGDVGYKQLREEGPRRFQTTGGWLGITDKFWLAALIPDQKAPVETTFQHGGSDRFQTDFIMAPAVVGPGQTTAVTNHLYAGAKEVDLINAVRDGLGVPLFDRSIAWGWFWFIAQPIFFLLDWLFKLFGNFGVAIICLTLIVRTIMFPIANRQYASMAKMRMLMPKMKELQERWKDDKLKQQQEIMGLYQKEKVNPLAGCFPILIQIPIFYALYKTLLVTIEMRHQPFALWIKDLSAPDPLTPVNLFGLLPFTPPQVIAIGVLPILLGISYWAQQKLSPQPLDEIQAKVFAFMPWIFMFIMAPFAAGLVIYWIVSNLFTIGQQWVLNRRYPVPATPPAAASASAKGK